jgi:hypothetical protein
MSDAKNGAVSDGIVDREPRWAAAVGVLAAAFLPLAVPQSLHPIPPWALAGTVGVLVLAATVARHRGMHRANEWLGYAVVVILTLAMLFTLGTLIRALPGRREPPSRLLASAAVIWVTNVVVFASWYWRLDAGGPNQRERRDTHTRGAFLFPQMAVPSPGTNGVSIAEAEGWKPHFVDYLALSFYTSTAFSPTDVPVLTLWAKILMMLQAAISLTSVVLLASRAVNIL